jgi:hypothetical protein
VRRRLLLRIHTYTGLLEVDPAVLLGAVLALLDVAVVAITEAHGRAGRRLALRPALRAARADSLCVGGVVGATDVAGGAQRRLLSGRTRAVGRLKGLGRRRGLLLLTACVLQALGLVAAAVDDVVVVVVVVVVD